jgi:hypothetical protein
MERLVSVRFLRQISDSHERAEWKFTDHAQRFYRLSLPFPIAL